VKSIGLSNFNEEQIHHLLIGARVQPATNHIECNPYFAQRDLGEFCSKKRILITAMNIYGMPSLLEDPLVNISMDSVYG